MKKFILLIKLCKFISIKKIIYNIQSIWILCWPKVDMDGHHWPKGHQKWGHISNQIIEIWFLCPRISIRISSKYKNLEPRQIFQWPVINLKKGRKLNEEGEGWICQFHVKVGYGWPKDKITNSDGGYSCVLFLSESLFQGDIKEGTRNDLAKGILAEIIWNQMQLR